MKQRTYTFKVEFRNDDGEVYASEYIDVDARNEREAESALKEEAKLSHHAYEADDTKFTFSLLNEAFSDISNSRYPGYDEDGYRF